MAVFPRVEVETIVQEDDKLRIDVAKSFVTQDESAIDTVEIQPAAAEDFIDVSSDLYLDWVYSSAGDQVVSVRVTTLLAEATATITKTVTVVTAADDKLFSTDQDLIDQEPEIMDFLPEGKSSFNSTHRRAQTLMLKWLQKEGYRDSAGGVFTKADIIDTDEVQQWSAFLVLKLIYQGLSNASDDVFKDKALFYNHEMLKFRKSSLRAIDTNNDGTLSDGEGISTHEGKIFRR